MGGKKPHIMRINTNSPNKLHQNWIKTSLVKKKKKAPHLNFI